MRCTYSSSGADMTQSSAIRIKVVPDFNPKWRDKLKTFG